MRVSTESWHWRRKCSRRSCRDANPRPFDRDRVRRSNHWAIPAPQLFRQCRLCALDWHLSHGLPFVVVCGNDLSPGSRDLSAAQRMTRRNGSFFKTPLWSLSYLPHASQLCRRRAVTPKTFSAKPTKRKAKRMLSTGHEMKNVKGYIHWAQSDEQRTTAKEGLDLFLLVSSAWA